MEVQYNGSEWFFTLNNGLFAAEGEVKVSGFATRLGAERAMMLVSQINGKPYVGYQSPIKPQPNYGSKQLLINPLPNKEEVEVFLSLIKTDNFQYYLIFALAIYCGLRLGEVVNLKWQDIDFLGRFIIQNSQKSQGQGRAKIPENLLMDLDKYYKT